MAVARKAEYVFDQSLVMVECLAAVRTWIEELTYKSNHNGER